MTEIVVAIIEERAANEQAKADGRPMPHPNPWDDALPRLPAEAIPEQSVQWHSDFAREHAPGHRATLPVMRARVLDPSAIVPVRIRQARERLTGADGDVMSIKEVAKRLSVGASYVGQLERVGPSERGSSSRLPSMVQLFKVADALEVSPSELVRPLSDEDCEWCGLARPPGRTKFCCDHCRDEAAYNRTLAE